MVTSQYATWLIMPSLYTSRLLAFLTTPMSLLIIFSLLCWLLFVYIFLSNECPPQPSRLTFHYVLGNPNYSQGVDSILKIRKSLFSFNLSTQINVFKTSFTPPNYSFSVSYLGEWCHHPLSCQSQNLKSHV